MTQEDILKLVSAHPDGIMQAEVCKHIMGCNGGYVAQHILQLKRKNLIRRENVKGNWKVEL